VNKNQSRVRIRTKIAHRLDKDVLSGTAVTDRDIQAKVSEMGLDVNDDDDFRTAASKIVDAILLARK